MCHTKRANYQAAIHRRSHNINAPSPTTAGWGDDNGCFSIVWNTMPVAPEVLLKDISCKCKRRGCGMDSSCSCHRYGVHCTELCKCVGCTNVPPPSDDDATNGQSETSDDDMDGSDDDNE